jgi:hypothetical protein
VVTQDDSVSSALRLASFQLWTARTVLLSVVVVPAVAVFWLRHLARQRARRQKIELWITGIFSMLLYSVIAFVFSVCAGGEIGESGKTRLARAYGEPVVHALEAYRADHQQYPLVLPDLVPKYLTAEALRAPAGPPLGYPFEYRRDSSSYELLVRYVGPGMNECRHTARGPWSCSGYF